MVIIGIVAGVQTQEKGGTTYKTVSIEGFNLLATDIDPLPTKDTFIKAVVSNLFFPLY